MRIRSAEVSDAEPGIVPIKLSIREGILLINPLYASERAVAPEYPSTGILSFKETQTLSPESSVG